MRVKLSKSDMSEGDSVTRAGSVNVDKAVSFIVYIIIGVVLLLGHAIGRERAFCSHPDVVRTLTSPPTPFCSISGKKPHVCKYTH